MNNKKPSKTKTTVKTMNFPIPKEEFKQLMTEKISEAKEDVEHADPADESNVIHVDFKLKKQVS
jgi:hypothetical protein